MDAVIGVAIRIAACASIDQISYDTDTRACGLIARPVGRTWSAIQHVRTGTPVQGIVARTTIQRVITNTAVKGVATATTVNRIYTIPTIERIGTIAGGSRVIDAR